MKRNKFLKLAIFTLLLTMPLFLSAAVKKSGSTKKSSKHSSPEKSKTSTSSSPESNGNSGSSSESSSGSSGTKSSEGTSE